MNFRLFSSPSARRRLALALTVGLLIPLFITAKVAASWRPTKIGDVAQGNGLMIEQMPVIAATKDQVVIAFNHECAWFDLHTGQKRVADHFFRGATADGRGLWWVKGKMPCQLVIEQDGQTRAFDIPAPASSWMQNDSLLPMSVKASSDRVEALLGLLYLRWSPKSSKPQKQLDLARVSGIPKSYECDKYGYRDFGDCGDYNLNGRDKVVASFGNDLLAISTQSGRVTKRVPVERPRFGAGPLTELFALRRFSPRGTYAIIEDTDSGEYRVVATGNGRTLWTIGRRCSVNFSLSADERTIVIEIDGRWEIRDLATGKLQGTAPKLFYFDFTGISPDANTLYSIEDGSLYRQRIR